MFIPLFIVCAAILALMGLKLARTVQEFRASRAGYITFGGDDRYQAKNVHLNVHDAAMIARVKVEMTEDAFEAVIRRIEQNYLRWHQSVSASIPPQARWKGIRHSSGDKERVREVRAHRHPAPGEDHRL